MLNYRHLLLLFLGGVLLAGCTRTTYPDGSTGASPAVDPTDPFGLPQATHAVKVITRTSYTSGFSEALRVPLWVSYHLVGSGTSDASPRPATFTHDDDVPRSAYHADYDNTGYDRGHMAPNAPIAKRFGT